MKTKVVYVLTSNGHDNYAAMLCLSLYTLRRRNRDADVLVVMDAQTHEALQKQASPIFTYAKPIIVDIPGEYNVLQQSRYLKTTLRMIIEGDFLFLDCDTLIAEKLDEIDLVQSSLAFVEDLNGPSIVCCFFSYTNELAKRAGFLEPDNEPYFNSGVMFVRDTPLNRRFFAMWHECWKKSLVNGVPQDQPALIEANRLLDHPIQKLPGIYNCQFGLYHIFTYYKLFFVKAKVLHYYSKFNFAKWRIITIALDRVKARGYVDFFTSVLMRYPRIVIYDLHFSLFRWKIKKKFGID